MSERETPSGRNHVADMDAMINKWCDGDYNARETAAEIVQWCLNFDPDLLHGWLLQRAEHLLWQAISDRARSSRAHARQVASRSVFRQAAEEFEAGDRADVAPIADWLTTPWTIEPGNTKLLRHMNKDDLETAALGYFDLAKRHTMSATFLEALSRAVGDGTVEDRYTNAELTAMWASLGH